MTCIKNINSDLSCHLFLFYTFSSAPILTLVIPTYHATFFLSTFSSAPIFTVVLNPDLPRHLFLLSTFSSAPILTPSAPILTLVIPTYHATFFSLYFLFSTHLHPSIKSRPTTPPFSSLYFLFSTHPHPSNPDLPRHLFFLSTFSSAPILTLVIPTYHATFLLSTFSSVPILTPVIPTYHATFFFSLLSLQHPSSP